MPKHDPCDKDFPILIEFDVFIPVHNLLFLQCCLFSYYQCVGNIEGGGGGGGGGFIKISSKSTF